ncbi:MAG: septum formation inhibitor Maf [Armatimonadetes bacterium]|nr:septum formation inhibitor Maf [Armatimonadota bacterium]
MGGQPRLILASASPRRKALLEQAGYAFEVRPAEGAEQPPAAGECPADYARRSAELKAESVSDAAPEALVLGADTVVAIGDEVLGKPTDAADACRMVGRLSGRSHWVHSGIAAAFAGRVLRSEVVSTEVWFRSLSSEEVAAYVETGEPFDKAGAYGIQGRGALLVERICGCYFAVVGLPLSRTHQLLAAASELITAGNGAFQC